MEFDKDEEFEGDFNVSISEIKQKVDTANVCLIPALVKLSW